MIWPFFPKSPLFVLWLASERCERFSFECENVYVCFFIIYLIKYLLQDCPNWESAHDWLTTLLWCPKWNFPDLFYDHMLYGSFFRWDILFLNTLWRILQRKPFAFWSTRICRIVSQTFKVPCHFLINFTKFFIIFF